MRIKRLLAAGMAIIMCVVFTAGCGNSGSSTDKSSAGTSKTTSTTNSSSSENEKPVTLKVLAGQSTTDAGIEKMVDKALAKKYPNIKLEWECVDWGKDFQPKMQVYMQSGLPDIMIGKAQDVITYGSQGVLGDLTGKKCLSEVMDAAKTGVTLNGKTLGLTYNALYQGVYYNRDLFKKYKVEIPTTQAELQTAIDTFKKNGITPFGTHLSDTWSIGNVTMQFAVNEVFNKTPDWGDQFRAGKVSFQTSPEYKKCYEYNKLLYDNTWKDQAFSTEQTACDAKIVQGKAAMKVSGSWSIQNFLNIDENFDFGIFPFPNSTGNAKLLFEPNITLMKSAKSEYSDAIDKVFEVIGTDKDLALEICNFTKTASMLKNVIPTFPNPSQTDIDKYVARGQIQDVNLGNNQLKWGGFQEENAKDIAEYLQGKITVEEALKAADSRKANSKA